MTTITVTNPEPLALFTTDHLRTVFNRDEILRELELGNPPRRTVGRGVVNHDHLVPATFQGLQLPEGVVEIWVVWKSEQKVAESGLAIRQATPSPCRSTDS